MVLVAVAPWQQGRPATITTIALMGMYVLKSPQGDAAFAPFLHCLLAVDSL
jgi:hypothetical protein